MTNIIPIRPTGKGTNPPHTIERLFALCERLKQVKNEALVLEQSLQGDVASIPNGLAARSAASQAVELASNGIDLISTAIAELIVETVADVVVSKSPVEN